MVSYYTAKGISGNRTDRLSVNCYTRYQITSIGSDRKRLAATGVYTYKTRRRDAASAACRGSNC